jgi:hypothetical protein
MATGALLAMEANVRRLPGFDLVGIYHSMDTLSIGPSLSRDQSSGPDPLGFGARIGLDRRQGAHTGCRSALASPTVSDRTGQYV